MDLADLSALLGEDVAAEAFSDVWVVLPPHGGAGAATALLGVARRLADGLGCYVHAVTSDEASGEGAMALGADRAHVTTDAAAYLADQHPEFVLLPSRLNHLAACLAQHFEAGLITNATGSLEVDPETRALLGSRPVYRGEYYLDLAVTSKVKLATVDTGRLEAPQPDVGRQGEALPDDWAVRNAKLADMGVSSYLPPNWRPLSKAHIIVAIGRGLGDSEAVSLARQLAERLDGEMAGDRSARDLGWIDEAHEVSITAQEVAPDLYLCFGIQGDTVHNAAVANARQVIAIHSSPQASIFQAADLAFVAEPKEVLAALLAALG